MSCSAVTSALCASTQQHFSPSELLLRMQFTAVLASQGVKVKPFELNYTTPANDIILAVMASEAAANFDYWQRSHRDDTNRRQDFWPPLLRLARMIPAVEYIQVLLHQECQHLNVSLYDYLWYSYKYGRHACLLLADHMRRNFCASANGTSSALAEGCHCAITGTASQDSALTGGGWAHVCCRHRCIYRQHQRRAGDGQPGVSAHNGCATWDTATLGRAKQHPEIPALVGHLRQSPDRC